MHERVKWGADKKQTNNLLPVIDARWALKIEMKCERTIKGKESRQVSGTCMIFINLWLEL